MPLDLCRAGMASSYQCRRPAYLAYLTSVKDLASGRALTSDAVICCVVACRDRPSCARPRSGLCREDEGDRV